MALHKYFLIMSGCLLCVSLTLFPLTVYFTNDTIDPDAYQAVSWFISLPLFFCGVVCGIIAVCSWLNEKARPEKLSIMGDLD